MSEPLTKLMPINSRMQAALTRLGITNLDTLVRYFPFRHDDFTQHVPIAKAPIGEHVTIVAKVAKVGLRRTFRRRISFTEARLEDASGSVTALWFNQPYLVKYFKVGETYRFAGKVTRGKMGLRLVGPLYEQNDKDGSAYAAPFVPVYPATAGISQHTLRRLMLAAKPYMADLPDPLPDDVRRKYGLDPYAPALISIHFPRTAAELRAAKRRLGFDELFRLQLYVGRARRERAQRRAPAVVFDEAATKEFVADLPFKLTDDQRRAAWEIIQDMGRTAPMSRLLDGDVGSGKTVVAAMAALNACRGGWQAALMAPTEILAAQHFETLKKLYAKTGLSIALWTNAYKKSARRGRTTVCGGKKECQALADSIADGTIGLAIGTHALVEEKLRFSRLALAVVDEQHRFGVRIRQLLCQKSGMPGFEPHLLSMTATPIPRSLALTVYGDLDLSLLREKPAERLPVMTSVIWPGDEAGAYDLVRQEAAAGRQTFAVCPAIEQSDVPDAVSVEELYERLSTTEFAGIPMAILHGRLAADDKERVMKDFLEKRVMILLSTSVVEVGVDVPNATVMMIFAAERFGLAQLHQFRGRVGRGKHQSHCLLLAGSASDEAAERLKSVAETPDGFALAEKDLDLRGAGDLLGQVQSGWPPFRVASLRDVELIKDAKDAATAVLDDDPELERHPSLKGLMDIPEEQVHLE